MIRPAAEMAFGFASQRTPREGLGETYGLLDTLFKSATVGVAICDRQLRFRAVNDALASMNGLPAAAHLGKTIHAVLGKVAAQVQPAFEHVFATGQPLSNFQLTAELPTRGEVGHWNESYFPIKDSAGRVQQVGAIILELPKRGELEASLARLTANLEGIGFALRHDFDGLEPERLLRGSASGAESLARSTALLEDCLSETRAISQLLRAAPPLTTAQPPLRSSRIRRGRLEPEKRRTFAVAYPLESSVERMSPLSCREYEVVALLAGGKSNKEVAVSLGISTRTVETHRAKIMLKLDLHSLGELVRYAVRSHFIEP